MDISCSLSNKRSAFHGFRLLLLWTFPVLSVVNGFHGLAAERRHLPCRILTGTGVTFGGTSLSGWQVHCSKLCGQTDVYSPKTLTSVVPKKADWFLTILFNNVRNSKTNAQSWPLWLSVAALMVAAEKGLKAKIHRFVEDSRLVLSPLKVNVGPIGLHGIFVDLQNRWPNFISIQ